MQGGSEHPPAGPSTGPRPRRGHLRSPPLRVAERSDGIHDGAEQGCICIANNQWALLLVPD